MILRLMQRKLKLGPKLNDIGVGIMGMVRTLVSQKMYQQLNLFDHSTLTIKIFFSL